MNALSGRTQREVDPETYEHAKVVVKVVLAGGLVAVLLAVFFAVFGRKGNK